jgi:heme-degrading monooxygenase HmoA
MSNFILVQHLSFQNLYRELTMTEWESLQHSIDHTASPGFALFDEILKPLLTGEVVKRHALVSSLTPGCESLGRGSPFTGTAIYLSTKPTWEYQSLQWGQIVKNVPGFRGYAGGPMLEPVDGHERAYILLVGWDTVEDHDDYHHTQHFKRIGYKVGVP